jgi:CubicO group peptidase (beta-lactamase class C family)
MKCRTSGIRLRLRYIVAPLVILSALIGCSEYRLDEESLRAFEQEIESLRSEYEIPGMSVAVVHKQKVIVARGFGYADLENEIPATENTPYNLASCTKPIAAVVLMQLVEAGRLDLDSPIAEVLADTAIPIRYYGKEIRGYTSFYNLLKGIIDDTSNPLSSEFRGIFGDYHLGTEVITVRHHLTHTSEGVPGETFRYNGDLYSFLSWVVEELSDKRFDRVLVENITLPLDMTSTVPSNDPDTWDSVLAKRSKYYRTGRDGEFVEAQENRPIKWPDAFEELGLEIDPSFLINAGAGMVSTAVDLAKFDVALDRNLLLSQEFKDMMFTAHVSNSGERLPYGLGWFVQEIGGTELVWHFGYGGIHSSLILKVPEEEITFILLANSGGASAKFQLGDGDVLKSPFASAFIENLTNVTVEEPNQDG